jgi:SAM-dependent methyltransferase
MRPIGDITSSKLLRLISRRGSYQDYVPPDDNALFKRGFASSAEFFKRYKGRVDFKDKTVLDMGCGRGPTCYYVVLNGAAKAVGVDIRKGLLDFAQSKISEYPTCQDRVEFKPLSDLGAAQFDIVLSKDSFEHFENPEKFISFLKYHLKPGGRIVIGFSPLWKSPYGGHTWTLSSWPWIHLVFPESVVMAELRRYYKNDAFRSYKDVATGLNKMTLNRFTEIVKENGLKIDYVGFNVSSQMKSICILTLFKGLRLIPGLKEYFTVNLYSILQIKESS